MDKFSDLPTTLTAPARFAVAISPSDATDLAELPRAFYIGQTGDISLRLPEGGSVLIANAQAGSLLPVRAVGVNFTGTTASDIVALW
ncbi:MAG: hypothetical protein WBA92_09090 [Pseudorhodobacter sp.]